MNPHQRLAQIKSVKSKQRLDSQGRFIVSKKAWVIRIIAVAGMLGLIAGESFVAVQNKDPMAFAITLLPIHAFVIMLIAWFFYRSPSGSRLDDKVTVIVPVYNQKNMIRLTLEAIYNSTYRNIAVVCINDGSTDGTKDILDDIVASKQYRNLTVLHTKNGGKRKAVATAFYYSEKYIKSEYIVMVDSDSILDGNAIEQIMRAFGGNQIYTDSHPIGGVVGQAKVWNSKKNLLTRCQDAWYDYAFNLEKCCQSYFGNVLCCSGCLSAYRVDAIRDFIPFWITTKLKDSEDRELTTFVMSPGSMKQRYWNSITKERKSVSDRLKAAVNRAKKSSAAYDYAEDRALSAAALAKEWKTVYVASAIVYTDVPDNWRQLLRQQKRWKKGTLRVNCYVSLFFWRKNPILSILIFYVDFAMTFIAGALLIMSFTYIPLTTQSVWPTLLFVAGSLSLSIVHGLDYKMRDPSAKNWYYKPLMNCITGFVLTWMWIPALIAMSKNEWGTR